MTMVPELFIARVPAPLVRERVEAPEVSPTIRVPALVKLSVPFKKAKVVVPLVAIRPVPELLSTSLPLVKLLVPDVCQESALVLLNVALDAPDMSTLPVMRPALLIVTAPVPAVVAPIARAF